MRHERPAAASKARVVLLGAASYCSQTMARPWPAAGHVHLPQLAESAGVSDQTGMWWPAGRPSEGQRPGAGQTTNSTQKGDAAQGKQALICFVGALQWECDGGCCINNKGSCGRQCGADGGECACGKVVIVFPTLMRDGDECFSEA